MFINADHGEFSLAFYVIALRSYLRCEQVLYCFIINIIIIIIIIIIVIIPCLIRFIYRFSQG